MADEVKWRLGMNTILKSKSVRNSRNLGAEAGFADSSNHEGTLQTKQFRLTK